MRGFWCVWVASGLMAGGVSCSGQTVVNQATAEPVAAQAAPADDAQAVAVLQAAGARFDYNDQGRIRAVELIKSKITDDDLKCLARLPSLEILEIGGGKVTDAGTVHLEGLVQLQKLYLHDLPLTDAALRHLARLPNLRVLSLQRTRVTGKGLVHFKGHKNLNVINLSFTKADDTALAAMKHIPNLDTIAVEATLVTGDGLRHLNRLARLRVLNLNRCKVNDPDLYHLVGLDELRMLYLRDCNVTDENIEKFKDKMTSLAVFY